MKTQETYVTLRNLCRWEMSSEVKELLMDGVYNIDILYDNGCFFRLALSSETPEILDILLGYYHDQNGLREKPETYNMEQRQAKFKLLEILKDAVISEDMQKILDNYGIYQNYDNSSTHSQEEIEEIFNSQEVNDHDLSVSDRIDTPPMRKSHSMDDIKNYGKKSNSTHEHSDEELLKVEKAQDLELIKLKNDLGIDCDFHQENLESEIAGNFKDFYHSD